MFSMSLKWIKKCILYNIVLVLPYINCSYASYNWKLMRELNTRAVMYNMMTVVNTAV